MSVSSFRRTVVTAMAALLAGIFLTTGAAPAQAGPVSLHEATETGRLEGWVTDPGGLPLAGVTVTLEPGGYQQTSDASGRVDFTGIPAGQYQGSASAILNGNCPVASSLSLAIDQYGLVVRFTLYPVNGDVCPPPAEPDVPAATLGGIVWGEGEITVTLEPGGLQAVANEWGGFEFPGLAPGAYTMTATAAGADCGLTASVETVLNGQDQWFDLFLEPATCS
jgi:hypothetical protein